MSHGKAVIISTDVYSPPKMVKKLASSLNSKIDHPSRDMSVGYKKEMVESYLRDKNATDVSKVITSEAVPQNAHERDALAAAIGTYKKYEKKLNQIEIRTATMELRQEQLESIKIKFIEGKNITSAIKLVLDQPEIDEKNITQEALPSKSSLSDREPKIESQEDLISKYKWKIKLQEKQIKNLKSRNSLLEADIENNRKQILKLQEKIHKLHYEYSKDILYEKEIASKISLIKKLQDKYIQEKKLRHNLESNLQSIKNLKTKRSLKTSKSATPVKIVEYFTRDGINKACEYWKIKKGDVVLLKNSKGGGSQTASLIISMGVKAVLIQEKMSHQAKEEFEKNMVPLLQADQMNLKMIDQFALVDTANLQNAIKKWKSVIEKEKIRENEKELIKVFDEYRAKRRRNSNNS